MMKSYEDTYKEQPKKAKTLEKNDHPEVDLIYLTPKESI